MLKDYEHNFGTQSVFIVFHDYLIKISNVVGFNSKNSKEDFLLH